MHMYDYKSIPSIWLELWNLKAVADYHEYKLAGNDKLVVCYVVKWYVCTLWKENFSTSQLYNEALMWKSCKSCQNVEEQKYQIGKSFNTSFWDFFYHT